MLGSLAEGVVFAVLVMLAMLVPAGLLWATMRAYDLVMDHRDRQRQRRVMADSEGGCCAYVGVTGAEDYIAITVYPSSE